MSQFHAFALDGFALTELDSYGCQWTVEDIQGWFTGAGVRTSVEQKAQQSGSRRGVAYREGRVITARGKVFCPDATAMEMAGRRLSAVLADGGFGEFIGESDAGHFSTIVQLEEAPLFDPRSSDWATWQITVGSEDHRLYGAPVFTSTTLGSAAGGTGRVWPRVWPTDYGTPPGVVPGGAFLPNAGSTSYHPRVRIDGGVTNPRLVMAETGDVISVRYAIPDGQWVDFNAGKPREVLLNGQVSLRHLTTIIGNALAVPVGGGSLTVTADSYTAAHSVSVWGFERADQ